MSEKVLLIGSGGREHALAWKLSQSPLVSKVVVAPGNAGTACGNTKISNVELDIKDFASIAQWCTANSITFVMVGPEDPLAAGIADYLSKNADLPVFGPSAKAAQIEADKSFSKHFMVRHNIPTARFESFKDPDLACKYIQEADHKALVVKASGLAAGKGVVVASSTEEACEAVKTIMTEKAFGTAGETVVVEELLEGPEVSILAFSDGKNVSLMPPSQDHKRLLDNDQGPNTGGMGAICPYPGLTESQLERIKTDIIEKTVHGMAQEGARYVGVLYAGLMLTADGPKVLEFNCRFGDPETQSVLSLLESDLMPTLKACVSGNLPLSPPTFDLSQAAAGVVLASGGYPGSYKKGLEISGLSSAAESKSLQVFHAGTKLTSEGKVVTSGGRVLCVVARDSSLAAAIEKATEAAAKIHFEMAFFRRDIGRKTCASLQHLNSNQRPDRADSSDGLKYEDAGVDISEGNLLVQAIKPLAKMTRRAGCDADLGGFGGVFDLGTCGHARSKLTCRTRGVGRKIQYAASCGHHYNIGVDLVVQCVNDLLTSRAEPLYFLDYYATGKLDILVAEEVVRGMAEACVEAGCALIGGETAEMPGMYAGKDYDVAGMVVGAVPTALSSVSAKGNAGAGGVTEETDLSTRSGDAVIALTSSGLQHHDFDLLENILTAYDLSLNSLQGLNGGGTLAEEVLSPPTVYVKSVLPLLQSRKIKQFETVGCSLAQCLSLLVSPGLGVKVDAGQWHVGPVFGWMAAMAKLKPLELFGISSCGVAALLVVDPQNVPFVMKSLAETITDQAKVIGHIMTAAGDADQIIIERAEPIIDASRKIAFQEAPSNFDFVSQVECYVPSVSPTTQADLSHILATTHRPGAVISSNGKPPAFDLSTLGLSQPVLVSGTDGVGTKLKIAESLHQNSTVGIDLVAMCVNDLLASGADPLFFTCYLASGSNDLECLSEVTQGVAKGCEKAGCAFVEQQVSALPSIYSRNVYDLGGFSVGAVEKSCILPNPSQMKPGDVLIGLPSSGIHSNGFSLVRRIIEVNKMRFDMPSPFTPNVTLGQDLLTPTEIYVKAVLPAMRSGKVKGFAHITGGGLVENIPRVLPPGVDAALDAKKWTMLPVFGWLQHHGKISNYEMSRTFNCGLGAVLIVDSQYERDVLHILSENGNTTSTVGSLVQSKGHEATVTVANLMEALESSWPRPKLPERKKRVGVLISGSGTNLQALIDYTQNRANNSAAEIMLVISNVAKAGGLVRAQKAGIHTKVIGHKKFKSRAEFDAAVHDCLVEHKIELVCLAGFMRILTGEFTNKWTGRMLNIHPSLLPSFKGAHAHNMALEAGVRISGCSVHFVAEEVDGGAIVWQESVPVFPGDTVELLSERVKTVEHVAYPSALELVASGRVELGDSNKLVWNW
ncbi:trifunctional purine biosynthetic protein adenosine-3 [Plakobranchus ocellatus]|uniref:Trifunctional purine biosynthetic protein adenosine-3 n=1 Tax=Plakobranchus ocellatus TaxID=259542 RepID=A0AAV4A4H6_9GAST|nr:trifunctional purine biosynthetic protein adenosine-3 [Plakobranchus ocellatus]